MQTILEKHWHHLPEDEVLLLLDSNLEQGLDIFETRRRQAHFGKNLITPGRRKSAFIRFLLQFNNPLIYILLASSVITAVIKDPLDALIILAVVLINAVIGFIQESKAEKAIQALTLSMTTDATVIRSGQIQQIPSVDLVPGDIVILQAGMKTPADLRLLQTRDLQVAEAALTGESLPVAKMARQQMPLETVLADRKNMAYASTLITYGQGTGVVIATGDLTEIGRISALISEAHDLETPLTHKIGRFSRVILYVILVLSAITFGVGILRGQPLVDTFSAAVALAVAMIPEGLPAALTLTLAIGVTRMAKRRAIIRKLPAVETLGSVSVICSDKTGTLTQNQMTVQEIVAGGIAYQVTGSGYAPIGEIHKGEDLVDLHELPPGLEECLQAGLLCNDSRLVQKDGAWMAEGDPTEAALITTARKGLVNFSEVESRYPRKDTIPFDSQIQYMATLHHYSDGSGTQRAVVYLKGSVEAVAPRCSSALDENGQNIPICSDDIHQQVEQMAARGLRVLAFARCVMPDGTTSVYHDDISTGLTFLGLQGMIDPPRDEAIAAVKNCHNAGIQVKMITGDHPVTAEAIARQIGLVQPCASPDTTCVLTGRELADMTDRVLMESASQISVFARVSPEQKLRLVEALQARGNVVAMTGDGVNDGPALKQANVGIAMGITGTEVAKEAADMILVDDNFATIAVAVEEGRGVFDNLSKIIAWTLPTNLGEGMILLVAILAGLGLPILPIHILWINTVTASVLGLVLAVERIEGNIMLRPPRSSQAPILTNNLLRRIGLVGGIILVGAFGLYEIGLMQGFSTAQARTIAVNAIVVIEIFYLLNCRSLVQSVFQIGVFSNPWLLFSILTMMALQILFTYAPFMNEIMSSAPINAVAWLLILLVGIASYWVVETEKWLSRRKQQAVRG